MKNASSVPNWMSSLALALGATVPVLVFGGNVDRATAAAAEATEVVVSGLNNPRGLSFGPEGALYVAEAGSGGSGPCEEGPEGARCFGTTGSVTRIDREQGAVTRVATGWPSLASPDGSFATGPHDVSLHGRAGMFVTIGYGGDRSRTASLGPAGADFARLARATADGRWSLMEDLGAWVDNRGGWSQTTSTGWDGDKIVVAGDSFMWGKKMGSRDTSLKKADGSMAHTGKMEMGGKWTAMMGQAVSTRLDPPVLSPVSATDASFTIRLCAGASGAPGGFSVLWSASPESPCTASYSARPDASPYGLPPGACIELSLDGLPFDDGLGGSSACATGLTTGATYSISAHAHKSGRRKASLPSPPITIVVSDTNAPIVTLAASPSTLPAPGTVTLTATASDDVGVTHVDFHRDGTLVATDTTASDGFTAMVNLTTADIGTTSFTATAFDADGNSTTSNEATVVVTIATAGRFVSPSGDDIGNDCSGETSPCQTIAHALATAVDGETVWLLDGVYDAANQGAPQIAIPADTILRARNAGAAVVRLRLAVSGGFVRIEDVTIDRTDNSVAAVYATGGFPDLRGIRFAGAFVAPDGPGLVISGLADATLVPGNAANYAAGVDTSDVESAPLIAIMAAARLVVDGGTFDGNGFGLSSRSDDPGPGAIEVSEHGSLALNSVILRVVTRGIVLRDESVLEMSGCTIEARTMTRDGYGILVGAGFGFGPLVTIANSTIRGFAASTTDNASVAIGVTGRAVLFFDGTTLADSARGLAVAASGSAFAFATGLQISGNHHGAVRADGSLDLEVAGGTITGNGTATMPDALWFGAAHQSLRLRDVAVTGNASGLTVIGDATSSFDLGTSASPGGNTFAGNDPSISEATGIYVNVANGVVVSAQGNAFTANQQGADALGHYSLGIAPCGETSCDVTSGAGANYRIDSGTLRLAP